jgi:hypothetical protein
MQMREEGNNPIRISPIFLMRLQMVCQKLCGASGGNYANS